MNTHVQTITLVQEKQVVRQENNQQVLLQMLLDLW
jgi:hypothetical protein